MRTEITRIFILLTIREIYSKTNSTTFVIKSLPYSTLRVLGKVCGKLISRKLVLGDPTQLKARYLYKANESQSAWRS